MLYAGLLSDVYQTEYEFTVLNSQLPNAYSILPYDRARIRAQFDIVSGSQNFYRTLGHFFCSALNSASYGLYYSGLYADWGRFVGILRPLPPVVHDFVRHYDFFCTSPRYFSSP